MVLVTGAVVGITIGVVLLVSLVAAASGAAIAVWVVIKKRKRKCINVDPCVVDQELDTVTHVQLQDQELDTVAYVQLQDQDLATVAHVQLQDQDLATVAHVQLQDQDLATVARVAHIDGAGSDRAGLIRSENQNRIVRTDSSLSRSSRSFFDPNYQGVSTNNCRRKLSQRNYRIVNDRLAMAVDRPKLRCLIIGSPGDQAPHPGSVPKLKMSRYLPGVGKDVNEIQKMLQGDPSKDLSMVPQDGFQRTSDNLLSIFQKYIADQMSDIKLTIQNLSNGRKQINNIIIV